jgi:hypothetical protein
MESQVKITGEELQILLTHISECDECEHCAGLADKVLKALYERSTQEEKQSNERN